MKVHGTIRSNDVELRDYGVIYIIRIFHVWRQLNLEKFFIKNEKEQLYLKT